MIDETNKKYGRLTVQYYNKATRKWHCQCDCGNEKEVVGTDLRRGHTTSCGCYRNEQARKAVLHDLTNQKFGCLTVLKRDLSYQGHGVPSHWWCQCENCGTIKSISTSSLVSQHTVSCGCIRSKGEHKIAQLLNQYGINFVQEYKFPGYTNRRFDFAILNKAQEVVRLIEFDGIQHYYKPRAEHWASSSSLEETQQRDLEKNQIANLFSVPLIRIPYWKLNSLSILQLLDDTYLVKEN